jgi:hypothetical protein
MSTKLMWHKSRLAALAGFAVGILVTILIVMTFDALPASAEEPAPTVSCAEGYTPEAPECNDKLQFCPDSFSYISVEATCEERHVPNCAELEPQANCAERIRLNSLPETGQRLDLNTWFMVGLALVVTGVIAWALMVFKRNEKEHAEHLRLENFRKGR